MGGCVHDHIKRRYCSLSEGGLVMLKIYFNNIKCCCVKRRVKKLFFCALDEKFKGIKKLQNKDFEVSLRYASAEEIREINNEYRNVDKATDVLSFPMYDFNSEADIDEIVKEKNASVMLGDIVICKAVAKNQAKEFGHSFKREICFLALHGFLHLLGYDHIAKLDEEVMQAIANKILEKNKIYR